MTDIVERLNNEADRLERRAYGDRCTGPDCALASNVAKAAADEIERLRGLYEREHAYGYTQTQLLEATEARLAEAVGLIRDLLNPVVKDPNERLTAYLVAVARARAFLAKLEEKP